MKTMEGKEDDHASGLKVIVTTITGSITGTTMSLTVDGSLSVLEFKLLVQGKEGPPPEQRGPSKIGKKTIQVVSPDFQRVFFDGRELEEDDSTLEECGVKEDSALAFAVDKALGKKLRRAMRDSVGEDFSQQGDCEILGSVLTDLKGRILRQDKSTQLIDALFLKVFNTNFSKYKNVHDGFLTLDKGEGGETSDYIFWLLFEKVEGAFPFKTYYGIPVYTRLHRRKQQHLIGEEHPHSLVVHQRNYDEVGAPGYFGPEGQKMACAAHFAKGVGTQVFRNADDADPVGQTAASNLRKDFAVVEMSVPCETTGPITTNTPQIGGHISRAKTFQTAEIQNAVIRQINHEKIIAAEPLPATSKKGDSNTPWSTPGGRTVGIHISGDRDDGSMSVVRLDTSLRLAVVPSRRSKRIIDFSEGGPETKKRNTEAA